MRLKLDNSYTKSVSNKLTLATEKKEENALLSNIDLNLITESLAKQLTLNLSHLLNESIQINKHETEVIASAEFLLGLSDPCCIISFQLPDSPDLGILTIDAVLVQNFLQSLLSKSWHFNTHVSEIELSVIRQIAQQFLGNFSAALERRDLPLLKVHNIHFSPSIFIGKHRAQLSSCLSFSIKTRSNLGRISFCLPHKSLPSQRKNKKIILYTRKLHPTKK